MKKILIAAALALATATTASAGVLPVPGLSVVGAAEYHVNQKESQTALGLQYDYGKISAEAVGYELFASNGDHRFKGYDVRVSYDLGAVQPYVGYTKSQEYHYNYAVVGAAFKF